MQKSLTPRHVVEPSRTGQVGALASCSSARIVSTLCCFFLPPTRLSGLSFQASHGGREISPQVPCLCLGCRPGVATPAARVGAGGSGCYNVEFRACFMLLEV